MKPALIALLAISTSAVAAAETRRVELRDVQGWWGVVDQEKTASAPRVVQIRVAADHLRLRGLGQELALRRRGGDSFRCAATGLFKAATACRLTVAGPGRAKLWLGGGANAVDLVWLKPLHGPGSGPPPGFGPQP